MNNVYKIFAEMPSLEMTNIIRDIRLSKKEGKRAESLVPYAKMISENLNLDLENPTVTMRECLDVAKSDFMDALFDKILEGTFFCA